MRRILAALGLLVSSCTSAPAPPQPVATPSGPPPAGTIRLGYPAEPPTLDPVAVGGASSATRDVLRPVLPALFGLDEDLRPVPELAAGWPEASDVTADPFSVRLRLRAARWSDGTPITAGDVRFSWERLRDGPTGARYRFLRDVEVVSPRELVLRFDRTVRRWWALFSIEDMVLPAHAYSSDWASGPTVAGGPFRFAGGTPGLSVRLERNPTWFGGTAGAEAIEVLWVPDEETRLELLSRGELDVLYANGESNLGYRTRQRGFAEADGALSDGGASPSWGASWWEVGFDLEALGGRGAVARATAAAVDRTLAAEILEDTAQVMDGIPSRFPAAPPRGEGLPALPGPWDDVGGDLDAARRILRDAGFRARDGTFRDGDGPLEFLLAYPAGSSAASSLARFLHFRMREAGVRIEIVGVDADLLAREWMPEARADAYLVLRRGADAPDASAYLPEASHPVGVPGIEEDVGRTVAAATVRRLRAGIVVGVGAGGWLDAQEHMVETGAVLPLVRVRTFLVAAEGVAGPDAAGAATGPLWNAHRWRIGTG